MRSASVNFSPMGRPSVERSYNPFSTLWILSSRSEADASRLRSGRDDEASNRVRTAQTPKKTLLTVLIDSIKHKCTSFNYLSRHAHVQSSQCIRHLMQVKELKTTHKLKRALGINTLKQFSSYSIPKLGQKNPEKPAKQQKTRKNKPKQETRKNRGGVKHPHPTSIPQPTAPETAILSQPHEMEPRAGVEPAANSLQGCRSGH